MATRKGLLVPSDIAKFTQIQTPFSPCSFNQLYSIEYKEAMGCLGYEFWQTLINAKADFSTVEPYDADTTYNVDDRVSFEGEYKIALVQTSNLPSVATDWANAPRFAGSCTDSYEDFFCTFLGPYLAHVVLKERLPYIITQITDGGITYKGKSYSAQDANLINDLTIAVDRDKNLAWKMLQHFFSLDETEENVCFEKWPEYEQDDDDTECEGSSNDCFTQKQINYGGYRFG